MTNAEFPDIPFLGPPAAYVKGRRSGQPTVVVIHDTEGNEGITSAEDGAAYDKRRTDGTSTHFFTDPNSTVQCVYTWDQANAARATGNHIGIHIEMCGKASQTKAQWGDPNSAAMIDNTAKLVARLCKKYGFPVRRLTVQELQNGGKGIVGHVDITRAFGESDHTDPGPNFPWETLIAKANGYLGMQLKRHTMISLDGLHLAQLRYGMDDKDYSGYNMVWRLQRMLGVTPDGVYGDETAGALKKYMGSGDGKSVGMAEWVKLYGLSRGA
jgi:N-acetyl-anhydromuramyl-L-alanine amidase AmpD